MRSNVRALVGAAARASARPPRPTPRPSARARGRRGTANVVSSGAIMPARAPASIDMLQTVMRAFHVERADRRAGVLDDVAGARRRRRSRAISARMRSFAVTPGAQRALEAHLERLRLALQQALRREHVLDLARADAERERAERAVRRGVAVAAHDGHARLREPELGADHVDDARAARSRCRSSVMPCSRAVRLRACAAARAPASSTTAQAVGIVGIE